MIMVPGFVLGALFGAWRAYKKQGTKLDTLQYAAAHGIAFFVLGMFLSVAFDWLGWVFSHLVFLCSIGEVQLGY